MAIQIKKDGTEVSGLVDDNVIQPFSLEKTSVRGRMVRLGSVLTDIMEQHKYPAPVACLLSEMVTLCVLLSAMIKYDGTFSLQIKSDSAIKSMVADVTSSGEVRAYAGFDEELVKSETVGNTNTSDFYKLLGKGYMTFTVKSNIESEKSYQGIVGLQGKSIIKDVEHYFEQSEQIQTSFKIAVHPQDGYWRAGGIMIQNMPEEGGINSETLSIEDEEKWNRPMVMLLSCKDNEILSPHLHSADVLFRLFHEDGVVVYQPKSLRFGCQCSRDRVSAVIATLSNEDVKHLFEQDKNISVKCEFCSEEYIFDRDEVDKILQNRNKA